MGMANVLNDEKKQQVLALGRLGWSLRRIQQATHVRRETASTFSGCRGAISSLVATHHPVLLSTAREFHGSPTQ